MSENKYYYQDKYPDEHRKWAAGQENGSITGDFDRWLIEQLQAELKTTSETLSHQVKCLSSCQKARGQLQAENGKLEDEIVKYNDICVKERQESKQLQTEVVGFSKDILVLRQRIEQLQAEQETLLKFNNGLIAKLKALQWRPVSEGLPGKKFKGKDIYTFHKTLKTKLTWGNWPNSKAAINCLLNDYTHWMPIPERPKKDCRCITTDYPERTYEHAKDCPCYVPELPEPEKEAEDESI